MAQRVVHFLIHVPKCAGTTVEAHFEDHLGEGFLRAPRWESVLRNVVGNRYRLAPERLARVQVVSGHSLSVSLKAALPEAEVRESVLLRAPLGYFLSFYNYRWTRHARGFEPEPPSFPRWYAAQRQNPISRFLLNRYFEWGIPAIYRLSSAGRLAWLEDRFAGFHFVGSYTRARELIAGVSHELGITEQTEDRNVTRTPRLRSEDVPERLRQRIAEENRLDQALYERWADRGWQGRPAGPAPRLPQADHPRYLAGDLGSSVMKKVIR